MSSRPSTSRSPPNSAFPPLKVLIPTPTSDPSPAVLPPALSLHCVVQANVFLRAFVADFSGQKFEAVLDVAAQFQRYVAPTAGRYDLEEAIAHQFLEKRGETITASALRDQLRIIDVDNNSPALFPRVRAVQVQEDPRASSSLTSTTPHEAGGEALRQPPSTNTARSSRSREERLVQDGRPRGQRPLREGSKGMAAKNQLAQMQQEDQLAVEQSRDHQRCQ